jgi:hypothetical protein
MENLVEENKILRRILWETHGHKDQYGDDGQMQCPYCLVDFANDSVEEIERKLKESFKYEKR